MLSFTTAHVAVIALRYKEPDRQRPSRVPWNIRFRGADLPLAAVLGAMGTFAAWVSVVVLHTEARTVGVGWMVVGMVGYFVYRRRIGMDPRVECRIERRAAPEGFEELAYRSALVPIFGTDVNARAMSAAARLAGEDATVDALYVIEVPPQLSLESGMDEEETRAREVLDIARLRARERRLKVRTSIIRTRSAGAALAAEARSRGSDVVYLDTIHAPPSEAVLGPTASYLLRARPCRVVIETDNRLRSSNNGGGPA
jgi:APA family basic amino acid/polyamine antiporter